MNNKICLIIPPSIFLLDERVFPSLGILKVASSLEKEGYPVEVMDLSGISNFEDVVKLYCENNDTKIFGITTTTPQMPATAKVLRTIREHNKEAKVILGGPHPTLIGAAKKNEDKRSIKGRAYKSYEQMLEMFDVVVSGDGEYSIFEALKCLETGEKFVDADNPKGNLFMTNQMYEDTVWPARHLIDLESYKYTIEGMKSQSLIAQLGCPFKCTFCGGRETSMLRRIRMRSTQSIVDELEFMYKEYGYTGFMFYDDELNVNKKMIELMNAISSLQKRLGVEFRLRGFVKAELFTDDQAKAMYEAGFRWLLTGFESGSERILTNIKKQATREENTRAVQIAKRNGLKVKALMSIGHAGESKETINDTKQWLLEVKPDDFDCTIITTYPGTPYYDYAEQTAPGIWTYTSDITGDKLHGVELDYNETADYYKGDPDGGYKAYVFTDNISIEELVAERDALEKEVREKLNIPFNPAAASVNFEHSMGQTHLPSTILRKSKPKQTEQKKKVVSLNVLK